MNNEPSTPLTMHPQLGKHSRNSQKGLNHQNMKLMQKAFLKQGHDPLIAKGQPRNRIRNNAKAENLQLGEKQSKPNEIKDNANVIRLSETDNEPLTPLTTHPQLENHSRNSQKGLSHQNMKLTQKTVLKQGHDLSIAKGKHSRNSQDTANKSTYSSKKYIYGNLPLIDFPREHFPPSAAKSFSTYK
jgi:hypothetical protein